MIDNGCKCSVGTTLTEEGLRALDAELSEPTHRGLKALAKELDIPKAALEEHKRGCVMPRIRPPRDPSERVRPAKMVEREARKARGTTRAPAPVRPRAPARPPAPARDHEQHSPENEAQNEPPVRPRHPGEDRDPGDHDNRVLFIVEKIFANEWDARSVFTYAQRWCLHPDTVREHVKDAYMMTNVRPEDIEERRRIAMARREASIRKAWDELQGGAEFPDTMSKLLDTYEKQCTGWERAAGLYDDSTKVQVNFSSDPRFLEAVGHYLDIVQAVLAEPAAIGLLVADIPPDIVKRVVDAARTMLDERIEAQVEPARLAS